MSEPEECPERDQEREQAEGGECGEEHEEEEPVAAVVAMGGVEVAEEKLVVAAVWFPVDFEEVAEEWDGTDEEWDGEVGEHPNKEGPAGAA